jgi:hypothetical protein
MRRGLEDLLSRKSRPMTPLKFEEISLVCA